MHILRMDHLVLTVASIEKTLHFYCTQLGMQSVTFGEGRKAILCGNQKINLHESGKEFEPKAAKPTPGSIDLCLLTTTPLTEVMNQLQGQGIEIVEGPVERTGAKGKILSLYIRSTPTKTSLKSPR